MRSRPHIYSDAEAASIIAAAKALPSICGLRGLTYSTLFTLIAVTGLRVSEALALDGDDLDADNGVLRVRQGKNGKERSLPLDPSTVERLLDYRIERDRLIGRPAMPLFVTDKATRLTDCAARYNFAQVCQQIGLRSEQQYHRHGRGPRIHDLRHTFAVRTMIDWYRTGKDPACEMIRLTTYLGHSSPSGTYWYLEAVPELLDLAMARATPLRRETAKLLATWIGADKDEGKPQFPSIRGERLSRDALEHLVRKHCLTASRACPSIGTKRVTPHTLRHSTAMDLLQHGVDQAVIALWLGHENVETTQIYIHADMRMKEKALARVAAPTTPPGRFRPDDQLLAFLEGL